MSADFWMIGKNTLPQSHLMQFNLSTTRFWLAPLLVNFGRCGVLLQHRLLWFNHHDPWDMIYYQVSPLEIKSIDSRISFLCQLRFLECFNKKGGQSFPAVQHILPEENHSRSKQKIIHQASRQKAPSVNPPPNPCAIG